MQISLRIEAPANISPSQNKPRGLFLEFYGIFMTILHLNAAYMYI